MFAVILLLLSFSAVDNIVNENINVGEKINDGIWFKVDQLSRNQKVILSIQAVDMQDNISDNNQHFFTKKSRGPEVPGTLLSLVMN